MTCKIQQEWDRITKGYWMSGPRGINVMPGPFEWTKIAEWYQAELRQRVPPRAMPSLSGGNWGRCMGLALPTMKRKRQQTNDKNTKLPVSYGALVFMHCSGGSAKAQGVGSPSLENPPARLPCPL
eukprot:4500130-Amphidinium_carterae.2